MKPDHLVKYLCTALYATVVHGHNSMTFVSNDNEDRILSFRCNPSSLEMDDINLPGGAVYRHQFPESWEGTVMAKKPDSTVPVNRVVAEICFKAGQSTYYDISAIDNHTDNSGIHHMHPVNAPLSKYFRAGCDWFPCDNCYLKPNDPHTRSTDETDFIVEVGTKN